jgi:hypothetical protein
MPSLVDIIQQLTGVSSTDGHRYFEAVLHPGNGSNAEGVAFMSLQGNKFSVDAAVTGLESGQEHPFHIHGFPDGAPSRLPNPLTDDLDHDGYVETFEAETNAVGPVILSLNTAGTPTSDENAGPFPSANGLGVTVYHETFTFDPANPDQSAILNELQTLDHRALEIHGLSVPAGAGAGTLGEVNGTAGYAATLPAAGGIIHELTPASIEAQLLHELLSGNTDFLAGHTS